MRKIFSWCFALGCCLAASAASTAVFDDLVVRQMWPWRTNVVVECSVRNVNGPSKAVLTLAVDGQSLGTVPATAFRTSCAFARGGKLHLEFDPKAVPALAARRRVDSLQVTLSSEAVDAEDVLYVIYDLQKRGQFAIVTTEELRAGLWGAWEEKIWSASGLVQTGKPVWTGVTNNLDHALTKLVMRRIPAGGFKMGYASTADVGKSAPNIAQRGLRLRLHDHRASCPDAESRQRVG